MKIIAGAIFILTGAVLVSAAFIADAIMHVHASVKMPFSTEPLLYAGGFATLIGFIFLTTSLSGEAVERKRNKHPKE